MNLKLINDLGFAEKLNAKEAVTESGKSFLKGYRSFVYSNPVSCSLVNNFVNESKKFGFDTGIMSILESVLGYLKENNISWKLNSACEIIEGSQSTAFNYIAKTAVGKVQQLLEMNEAGVVSYIKSGALKDVMYVNEFRNICKEVYASNQINEVHTVTYSAITPCSYLFVEGKDTYFMNNGKTFVISQGNIKEAICNDPTFVRINSLISNMKMNEGALSYEYQNSFGGAVNKYVIKEGSIEFTRGNKETHTFENADDFISFVDTLSIALPVQEKLTFMQTAKAIKEVSESFDKICELDAIKNITTVNGDILSIGEGKDSTNVTLFRCMKHEAVSESFDKTTDALKFVEKYCGINLMGIYENRIVEEGKKFDNSANEEIKKELTQVREAQIADRREKIAILAEQFKNDPLKLSILNKCAKELSMLENKQ